MLYLQFHESNRCTGHHFINGCYMDVKLNNSKKSKDRRHATIVEAFCVKEPADLLIENVQNHGPIISSRLKGNSL